jgi:hypothetical protein
MATNYLTESVTHAAKQALENGFEVVYGDDEHLLLDFDNEAGLQTEPPFDAPEQYYKQLEVLNANGFYCHEEGRWSSKRFGLHVVVKLDNFSLEPLGRLALQAAMGSDPKRELLGVLRVLHHVEEPCMLFKPGS